MENLEKVQNHFNFKFVENWNDGLDFFIYEENTADGYSVYVATDDPQNIVISEDVYYYDSDLSIAFIEAVEDHTPELTTMEIYVEDVEEYWLEEAIDELALTIDNNLDTETYE
jgi:hypothetical protein